MKLTTKYLSKVLPASLFLKLRVLKNTYRKSLSQAGQDFWVFGEAFNGKRNGFFVEVGSADGITVSNTYLLEKYYHWDGICIEANPESFQELARIRNAKCINSCVGDKESDVEFLQSGLFSGIVGGDAGVPDGNTQQRVIRMRSRPLVSILKENGAPEIIDYLSVDVEGAEERVLGHFPFGKYHFRTATIERPSDKLRQVLSENGHVLVKEIPTLDCFYVHESFMAEYVVNVFEFWARHRA